MEIIAIPGGHSLGAIVGILFRHVDPARDRVGLADTIGAAALRHGFPESHHAGAGRNAVFGIDAAGEFVRRGAIGEDETRCHRSSAARRQDNRFDRRIPIRPNYHSAGRVPTLRLVRVTLRCGPPPHHGMKISQPERGGNGVSFGAVHLNADVVNQS